MRSVSLSILAGLTVVACGPAVRPASLDEPATTRATPAPTSRPAPTGAPGRAIVIGEMCPEGAAGRPAVAPLFERGVGWSADAAAVGARVERSVRAFTVLGIDGKRAGVFEVLGLADAGLPSAVAIGSYAGRGACVPYSEEGGAAADATCVAATGGCGIAIASVDTGAGSGEAPDVTAGGACVAGDALLVDLDGDGAAESFPIAAFVDEVRAPSEEVLAQPVVAPSCTPAFAHHGLVVAPARDPGEPDDPRYHVTLDVAGVADVDADGRVEVVVAFRYPDRRTLAVYTAVPPGRLELVGEAVPWQR